MRSKSTEDHGARRARVRDTAQARKRAQDAAYFAQLAETWQRQSGQRVRVSA